MGLNEHKDRSRNAQVKVICVPLYTRPGEGKEIKSGFQIQTHNGTRLNFVLFHKPAQLCVDTFSSTIMLFTSKPQDFGNRMKNELPLLINVSSFLSPRGLLFLQGSWPGAERQSAWCLGQPCGSPGRPRQGCGVPPHACVPSGTSSRRERMSGTRKIMVDPDVVETAEKERKGGEWHLSTVDAASVSEVDPEEGGAEASARADRVPLCPAYSRRSWGVAVQATPALASVGEEQSSRIRARHCLPHPAILHKSSDGWHPTSTHGGALPASLGEAFSLKPPSCERSGSETCAGHFLSRNSLQTLQAVKLLTRCSFHCPIHFAYGKRYYQ